MLRQTSGMSPTSTPIARPISRDWTVRHLLENLADDIDAAPLGLLLAVEWGLIERSTSGAAGLIERSTPRAAPWASRPHPVAVIRSIAALTRLDRSALLLTIGELTAASRAAEHVVGRRPSNSRARLGAEPQNTHGSANSSRTFDAAQSTLS